MKKSIPTHSESSLSLNFPNLPIFEKETSTFCWKSTLFLRLPTQLPTLWSPKSPKGDPHGSEVVAPRRATSNDVGCTELLLRVRETQKFLFKGYWKNPIRIREEQLKLTQTPTTTSMFFFLLVSWECCATFFSMMMNKVHAFNVFFQMNVWRSEKSLPSFPSQLRWI